MSHKKKDLLKIVLLGDKDVGKDALIHQFVYNQVLTEANKKKDTIHKKIVPVDEKQINVEFFPVSSGSDLTDALSGAECDGCIIVYDISSQASFDELPKLIESFVSHPLINNDRFPMVFIGNKYDLSATRRAVKKSEAIQWYKSYFPHNPTGADEIYEVSAKTADHIEIPFQRIARLAYYYERQPLSADRICLLAGCPEPRFNQGYCYRHYTAIDQSHHQQQLQTDPTQLILPILRQLNRTIQEKPQVKESPYLLSLLGSVRELILKIDQDKETVYNIVPAVQENDIIREPTSKSKDKNKGQSADPNKPLQLPAFFYRDVFNINHTMAELLARVNPPNKKQLKEIQKFYQQQQHHHDYGTATEPLQPNEITNLPANTLSSTSNTFYMISPQTKQLNTDPICPPVYGAPLIDFILHTSIAKPPIIDIQVFHNHRIIPFGYSILARSVGQRKADVNSGSGGKELILSYLRDQDIVNSYSVYTNGVFPTTILPMTATRLRHQDEENEQRIETSVGYHHEASLTKSSGTKTTSNEPTTLKSTTNRHLDDQQRKQMEKHERQKPSHMRNKPEVQIDLASTLQPITAVNLTCIFPQRREDAPFGYETISNMPDSTQANLNMGAGADNGLYLALHRSGPSPDYYVYAKDCFGEGTIDRDYINGSSSPQLQYLGDYLDESMSNIEHLSRNTLTNSFTRGIIQTMTNMGDLIDSIDHDDLGGFRRTPLTVLTEDTRAIVENYPLTGGRGCGAPIIDIGIMFPQKGGETLPVDWHELNVTLHRHNASLNSGTEGTDVKFIFRLDVVPVLEKIYRPFLDLIVKRQNECPDSATYYAFTQLCAVLTASIYAPSVSIIIETFEIIKQLQFQLCPAPILNAFIHAICDATPFLLSVLNSERRLILEVLTIMIEQVTKFLTQYTILRIFDVFYLFRSSDMTMDDQLKQVTLQYSGRVLKTLVTAANKSASMFRTVTERSPMSLLDPNGDYPHTVDLLTKHYDLDGVAVYLGKKSSRVQRRPSLTNIHKRRGSSGMVSMPPTPTLDPTTTDTSSSETPLASPPPLPEVDATNTSTDNNSDGTDDKPEVESSSTPKDDDVTTQSPAEGDDQNGHDNHASVHIADDEVSLTVTSGGGGDSTTSSTRRLPPPLPNSDSFNSLHRSTSSFSRNISDLGSSSPSLGSQPMPQFNAHGAATIGPGSTASSPHSKPPPMPPIHKALSVGAQSPNVTVLSPGSGKSPLPPAVSLSSPSTNTLTNHNILNNTGHSSVLRRRTQDEVKVIVENINENPYDMCAALIRHLADEVVSSKLTDQELGRLQRRPFGSQVYGDIACITDRLLTDKQPRNWLLQPPLGYGINPQLREKVSDEEILKKYPLGCQSPESSTSAATLSLAGLPTIATLSPISTSTTLPSPSTSSLPPLGIPTIDLLATNNNDEDIIPSPQANSNNPDQSSSPALGLPPGLPTIDILSADRQLSSEQAATPRNAESSPPPTTPAGLQALQKTLQQRKEHNLPALAATSPVIQTPESIAVARRRRFTTYTRVFHGGADFNPDGTPYQWRYFKIANALFETERERRRRRRREREQEKELEQEREALMFDEHRSELANRRAIIHNTSHQHYSIINKSERTVLSLLIFFSKISNSDTDTNPMHASSIKSLSYVTAAGYNSMADAYRAVSPFGIQVKDEMILRRVYALEMIQYILDRGDTCLKNNPAGVHIIRRFVLPGIINNCITTVSSMFYAALRTFLTICDKYHVECQAEIGLFIDTVILDMLLSPACPVDFKLHLFDLLELILNTPAKIINLYHAHDNSGRRNVYEKLVRVISIIILKADNHSKFVKSVNSASPSAKSQSQQSSGSGPANSQQQLTRSAVTNEPNAQLQRFEQQQNISGGSVVNNYSTTEKSYQEVIYEKLKKCALRMYTHQLHMLAQWTGVPSLKRSIDATNALKLTCKSYLHVLICSQHFPPTFLTSEDYTRNIEVAAKKLQMYFEAFPDRSQERPYIQMPGILEEFIRVEFEKELKQILGFTSGLTRKGTMRNLNLVKLTDSMTKFKNNLKIIASHISIQYKDVGVASTSAISSSHRFYAEGKPQHMQTIKEMRRKSLHQRQLSNGLLQFAQPAAGANNSGVPPGSLSPQMPSSPSMHDNNSRSSMSLSTTVISQHLSPQQILTNDTIDIDGKNVKTLEEESFVELMSALREQGDGFCIDIEKVLGSIPNHNTLELGLDLGHYLNMDLATINLVKKNPQFASTLTVQSTLAKQHDEALKIYNDATSQAIGKDSLKDMVKYIASKYPRWLTPMNMATLLYNNQLLDPSAKGDYLSNQDDKYFNADQFSQLRNAYTNLIDFNGMPFVAALRYYLTSCGFRMPGEGQKVSRLIGAFCHAFCRDNPDDFGNLDVAELVCMATIMLNTDLHNPSSVLGQKKGIKPPMTLVEFIKNVKNAGASGKRTDVLLLVGIYIDIATQAIEWINDDEDEEDDSILYQKQQMEQYYQQLRDAEQPQQLDPHGINNIPRPTPLNVNLSGSANHPPATPSVARGGGPGNGNPQQYSQQTNSTLTPQQIAAINYRTAIRNGIKLRSIRRQALCHIRLIGATKQMNTHTSSTQIIASLWNYVWQHYLKGITTKVESSPFFNPSAMAKAATSDGFDEVDFETLHLCIDCLAYGGAISIALGNTTARRAFVRILAKIAYIEQMNDFNRIEHLKLQESKDRKNKNDRGIDLSTTLHNRLLSGEHLKAAWYNTIEQSAVSNSVHACKTLLNTAMTTKANIAFQRRQQILRTMQEEFNNEIVLVDDTDRAFIRKGNLYKVSSSGKLQNYAFFLFNDLLIYASAESGNKTFKIHRPLHLSLVRIIQQQKTSHGGDASTGAGGNDSSAPSHAHRFKIVSPQKSIIVQTSSEAEMDTWVTLLQDCITKQLVRRSEWGSKISEAVKANILTPQMVPPNTVGIDTIPVKKRDEKKKNEAGQPEATPDEMMEEVRLKNIRRHAIFAASNSNKLKQLINGIRVGPPYCKLCIRHYKLLRRQTNCQNCLEEVCGDCCNHSHVTTDPLTNKKRSIKVCDACHGLLSGLIGDSQPLIMIEETI